MNICKTCIMPDTRPDTEFVDGECSACIAYRQRLAVDWEHRREMLRDVFNRHRSGPSRYDCIVPSSGGKDSTYQVITLLQMGYKPLVVTAETCHETSIGRQNISNLARYADTIVVKHNPELRKRLNLEALKTVGDISWPEHVAIFTVPFQAAVDYNISLIIYGENPQNQYGGPIESVDAMEMTRRWRSEFGGFLGMRPSDCESTLGLDAGAMAMYEMPETSGKNIEAHFLGQYIPWDSHENARVAVDHGMAQEYPGPNNFWPHENLDNAQTAIHDDIMYRKYGYTRAQAQISVDIRTGRQPRSEGETVLRFIPKRLPEYYAGERMIEVLERIGLTQKEYYAIADQFTNWDIMRRVHDDEGAAPILLNTEPVPGVN